MPFFVAKPITIEAFRWRGVIADLPLHAARHVLLQGYRPPLVAVADGVRPVMEDGSWLVIGPEGRPDVLTNAAFERRYEAAPELVAPVERPTLRLNKERVKA